MTEHKAGRELDVYEKWANKTHDMWMRRVDVFVAEKVMGIRIQDGNPCSHAGCLSHVSHPCEGCGRWHPSLVPHYSTQIADAKIASDKAGCVVVFAPHSSVRDGSYANRKKEWLVEMIPHGGTTDDAVWAYGETEELARCLAALKVVGHD